MTRKTQADWRQEIEWAKQLAFAAGREQGLKEAQNHQQAKITETKIQLVSSIGQAIQACSSLVDNVGPLR